MGSMGDAAAGNSVKVSLEISQGSRPEEILQISEIENMKPFTVERILPVAVLGKLSGHGRLHHITTGPPNIRVK